MQTSGGRFNLEVLLDALRGQQDRKADQAVQVVGGEDLKGSCTQAASPSAPAAAAVFSFVEHPGNVRVMVGRPTRRRKEITGLQTGRSSDARPPRAAKQPALRPPPSSSLLITGSGG